MRVTHVRVGGGVVAACTGLLLFSLIALLDVILKLVYVACTLGVNSVAPLFFPADCTR